MSKREDKAREKRREKQATRGRSTGKGGRCPPHALFFSYQDGGVLYYECANGCGYVGRG